MAECHSTRECVRCGTPLPEATGRGRKPKYCGAKCRNAYNQAKWRESERPPCSIDDCADPAKTRGMCAKHYQRWRAHGDPHYTTRGLRVAKPCQWCGKEMLLKPGMVDKRQACSVTCANHIKNRAAGYEYRLKTIVCKGCHQQVERTVKTSRDSGKFCSRQCFYSLQARVSVERNALRRIGDRRRKAVAERYKAIVAPEIAALRRIKQRINHRDKSFNCWGCGKPSHRLAKFSRWCSYDCRRNHLEESKRQARRIAKARRRARMRGIEHQSIDPLKVFERDKWRCHLCGVRTLKSKRGTHDDRAPELEHIVTLADGGTHTWGNVACSCRKCNLEKGAESRGQLGFAIA